MIVAIIVYMTIAIDFDGTITEEDKIKGVIQVEPIRKDFIEYLPKIAELGHNLVILTARYKPEHIENAKTRLEEIDYLKYFTDITNKKMFADFYFDDKSTIINWKLLYETLKENPEHIAKSYTKKLLEVI